MARSLLSLPKLPTSEDIMKKIRRKAGLPKIEKRKKKRLSIDEINLMGDDQLREHLAKIREPKDKRTTFTKVMDVIDIPRNLVANVIGSLTGVKKAKLQKGALGVPRVMMSDVLSKLGVKNKIVKGIVGFGLDVAADPLTYASLGAATGLKIGAGLPRMLKPGTRLLGRAAKAMTSGGAIPAKLAKVLGTTPQKMARMGARLTAKHGAKIAGKKLMSRRGGALTRLLARRARGFGKATEAGVKGAQVFMKQFAPKGRTLLRAPFAAKGLTIPVGKQARIFKELGDPRAVKEAMRLGRAGARLGKKTAAGMAAAKEATLAGKRIKEAKQAKKLIKLGVPLQKPRGPTVAQLGAKKAAAQAASTAAFGRQQQLGSKLRSAAMSPLAPEVVKGKALEKYGRQLLSQTELAAMGAGPVTRAKHTLIRGKRQLFGGPVSQITQQESGAMAALRRGPEAGRRMREPIDPVIETLVKRYGVSHEEVGRRLTNLAWAGGKEAKDIFPGDVVAKQLAALSKTPFPTDPDVVRLLKEGKAAREGQKAAQVAKGIYGAGGEVEGLGRHLTKPAEAFKAAEAKRVASTGFHPERERMLALTRQGGPLGPERQYATGRGPEKAGLIKAGYTEGKSYPISPEHWNAGLNPQTGKPMAQRMIGPGTPKPQVFVTDYAEQVARDASSHQYKMSMAELRDNVMKHGAWQVPQAQAAATPWQAQPFLSPNAKQGALYQLLAPDLAPNGIPLLMDRPVAEMLDRMNHVISSPEAVKKILHSYDVALGYWKTAALYHPGYIIRNIFQNIVGTVMGGGQPLRMIRHATNRRTQDMVNAIKAGKPVTGMIQTRIGPIPAKMVAEAMLKNNHIGTGFSSMLHTPSTYERMRKVFQNKALGLSFRTNQVVEDSMKAGAFINFLEQGMSVRQASMALAKSMPDLTMLTTFERNVMRRVFPFFSWYRRNGALQIAHYLPKYPAWAAASPKLRNAVQMAMVGDEAVDAQLRPSWQEEAQATQILGDSEAGQVFLMGSWLPFDDMVAVLGAAESPQDFMREMLERASPAAKFGAEMAVGVDIFRQRPIPKFTPQEFLYNAPKAIIGKSGSPLDNLLGIRPIKEYGRRVWEQPTLGGKITRGLIGGAIQPVSRERGLTARGQELRESARVLRAKLNRAVENRDQPEIQLLTKELFRAWAQMMEMGLPGVPKAAQAMMAKHGIEQK